MSKPRTHYAKPMTMGDSICHLGRGRVAFVGGGSGAGHPARVHYSTVDLVGTIEETTCKWCLRVYWREAQCIDVGRIKPISETDDKCERCGRINPRDSDKCVIATDGSVGE